VKSPVPPARHLLRAKDLVDARYREPLEVPALARAAHLSVAHFSREFRRAFGETPHQYLLTRRLERAAALLRNTDRTVADVCLAVGLRSVGSFTTSFGRAFGLSPAAYRAAHPPAVTHARIPACMLLAWARPFSAKPKMSGAAKRRRTRVMSAAPNHRSREVLGNREFQSSSFREDERAPSD
jgi:AraC-like DNA-binding protein